MMFTFFLAVPKYCRPAACLQQQRGKGNEVPPHKRHSTALCWCVKVQTRKMMFTIFFCPWPSTAGRSSTTKSPSSVIVRAPC